MPTIQIDGKEYEVEQGRTVLQAIDDLGLLMNGVEIPHYCWHPKLSIDGSCRLCQVEIEGVSKLQIACNTLVRDGMEIRTTTEAVRDAREGVMELLLLNHPLDCPICDQAGECKLQDYAFEYGAKHARTREPRRPAKKAIELGPTIVFDQERCILCRRCVRFCREVPRTGELGVFSRGEESRLEVFPGMKLDNPYSMNVADICPVGALTTKDFRFKVRVWFLDDVPSVCNGCSKGCNVWGSRSNNRLYRYLPRRNDAVNQTWICDTGRLSYKQFSEGRLSLPRIRGRETGYTEALAAAVRILSEAREAGAAVVGVASPFAANEDLFALRGLLSDLAAPDAVYTVPRGDSDDLLIQAEKAPNAAGARELGMRESAEGPGKAAVAIVLGHGFGPEAFEEVDALILIDTHESPLLQAAEVAVPSRSFAEKLGTFTNSARRVQRFQPMLEPRFEAWSEGEIVWRIGAGLGLDRFRSAYDPAAISRQIAEEFPAFAGISLESLDDAGRELG